MSRNEVVWGESQITMILKDNQSRRDSRKMREESLRGNGRSRSLDRRYKGERCFCRWIWLNIQYFRKSVEGNWGESTWESMTTCEETNFIRMLEINTILW